MIDPQVARQLLSQLSGATNSGAQDLDQRRRQSQVVFAATVEALRNGCQCEPCRLLRQSTDAIVAEAKKELAPNAPSLNTPA